MNNTSDEDKDFSTDSSKDGSNDDVSNKHIIALVLRDDLQKEQIVTSFAVRKKTKCIEVKLNHTYENKTIVSTIYPDWIKTVDTFTIRAKKKGISEKHIIMLTDTLDDNNENIIEECLLSKKQESDDYDTFDDSSKRTSALELAKQKTVELFLDEVKTPFAAISIDDHVETMPIESKRFEDWIGAAYYYNNKDYTENNNNSSSSASILSKEEINKIQSVLRYEANTSSRAQGSSKNHQQNIRTLHLRVAAFIDTDATDPSQNIIYYDLCNTNWDIIKITSQGWDILKHDQQNILFKRYPIINAQVLPSKDYPDDIMEQLMKLTNVYSDEDNKLLAEVYIISLFLLANLPKPIMIPHGIYGSGKSTFQEFVKRIVDPCAALTTAFPNNLRELVQELSHSYVVFFDNVSEISQVTSDQLCRAVTGSGFVKRGLYTNDEDIIYNMTRAVGYNGINVTATRPDLLDRILNLQLKPIDRRHRRRLKYLQKEFEKILPHLLGYIFDVLVKVLNRIGEVKLDELPRMADFAELGELISRCLGYPDGKFTEVYNRNISFTNEESIEANPVATAITVLMSTQATWAGKTEDLRLKLNELVSKKKELSGMFFAKGWPKTPRALSERLNEITPNLKEIGIIIHREHDAHSKSNSIIITNNNYVPTVISDKEFSSDYKRSNNDNDSQG
jgi:hypothetical protein